MDIYGDWNKAFFSDHFTNKENVKCEFKKITELPSIVKENKEL